MQFLVIQIEGIFIGIDGKNEGKKPHSHHMVQKKKQTNNQQKNITEIQNIHRIFIFKIHFKLYNKFSMSFKVLEFTNLISKFQKKNA